MSAQPTTDIYFRAACNDLVAGRWPLGEARRRPLRQIAPNTFRTLDPANPWLVMIRGDGPRAVRAALHWPGRLAYVIDDDVAAGAACEALPAAYRARLAAFDAAVHTPLLARADAVLVPSAALAHALVARGVAQERIVRIDPAWPMPPADTAHFAPLAAGGTLRLIHLGSGSHAPALAAMAPAVVAALDADPDTHLTYVAVRSVDAALEAHPRARRIEPKPWAEYHMWLMRQRFHLALYPLLPTAFDLARSANKLIEHAIVGAVGLYPRGWEQAARLRGGALAAPDDPTDWHEAIAAAIAGRDRLSTLADRAAAALTDPLAEPVAPPDCPWPPPPGPLAGIAARLRQRRLWSDLLGLAAAPPPWAA